MNNKPRNLIQVIDISSTFLYQQEKVENSMLALINAFVSHELRNPLNSIQAQNIEKAYIYEKIHKDLGKGKPNQFKEIIDNFQIQIKKL